MASRFEQFVAEWCDYRSLARAEREAIREAPAYLKAADAFAAGASFRVLDIHMAAALEAARSAAQT